MNKEKFYACKISIEVNARCKMLIYLIKYKLL